MQKMHPLPLDRVGHYLETAALFPQQRDEMIAHALQEILSCIPAVGTALIWPCRGKKVPWKVYYAGLSPHAMRRWLAARLDPSLDVMIGVLQNDQTRGLADQASPLFMHLRASTLPASALWIIWPSAPVASSLLRPGTDPIECIHPHFTALLEVESIEEQYFSASSPLYDRELIEALARGKSDALSVFLSVTRLVSQADLTYWGKAYSDIVEIVGHVGARTSGFGFVLPYGRGIGGRVAASGVPIADDDYRNSSYRDPSISALVDSEQLRSGLVLPVRNEAGHVSAVLYVTRRTVAPFSLTDRLFIQRLIRSIEPLPPATRHPSSFASVAVQHLLEHKSAWYNIMLHAHRFETLEEWLCQTIKGTAILADADDAPYVLARTEQLEQLKNALHSDQEREGVQVISLAAPGVRFPGQVYLRPSIPLPPPEWPDFFADVIIACNTVIARIEQVQGQIAHQREQWMRALLQEKSLHASAQEGYHLGLPIEHGQVWVIAWATETMQAMKSVRKRMIAERVVVETLKSPLILLDEVGVVLLDEQAVQKPAMVRDALLKHCGSHAIWMVHGGYYHSLHDLKMKLTQATSIAQRARREGREDYLLDTYTFRLDSLLENPGLTEDLNAFAMGLLSPLLKYDADHGSKLTETFILAQTLGSVQAVAQELEVHTNTIRNRLDRAKDLLGTDLSSPEESTAMALAAFIWRRFHSLRESAYLSPKSVR